MGRRTTAFIALGLAVIFFFAFNIFADVALRAVRLDLTQNQLFTLSRGTVETLHNIAEPITLRFYYGQKAATGYPQITSYAKRVEDMLSALKSEARGKLVIEIVKPELYSPEEDRAAQAGIAGVRTSTGDTIYFGIEGSNRADGHEVIPYLAPDRENLLEYDLVSLIDRLNRLKKPVLGLLGSLPLATGPGGPLAAMQGKSAPYRIYQDLEAKYKVTFLESDMTRVPADIDVLMIAQPTDLSPQALYAVDQFVLGGGHLIAFIDPLSELSLEASQGQGADTSSSNLEPLLSAWGVSMPAHEVVGDRTLARQVMMDQRTQRVVSFIPWLELTASEINRTDPVTSQINDIALASAGHLDAVKAAGTSITPLLTSSDDSMIVDGKQLETAPDPDGLLRDFRPSGIRYTLAARITGNARTAYPNGAPPPAKPAADAQSRPEPAPSPQLKQAKDGINVIVVADTDIFDDRLWLQTQNMQGQDVSVPIASNADFVLNAVDNLAGSNALLSLRGRQIAERKFDLVEDLRREAEARNLAEEERLNHQLAETERNLEALQHEGAEGAKAGAPLLPQQRAEIERFRQQLGQTRNKLRAVQRALRHDIDSLGDLLRLINILLMPAIVTAVAVTLALLERRRRAKGRPS